MKEPINIHVHIEQNQEFNWLMSDNIKKLCFFNSFEPTANPIFMCAEIIKAQTKSLLR